MPSMRKARQFHFYGPDRRTAATLKPEYALDRAEQLIAVGQEMTATMALYNIVTDNSQRKRQWTIKYEGIMLKLMEMCVKLRKQNLIKEALHKYRALCSHQNVASLEKVVRFLVEEGETKAAQARESVKGADVVEGAVTEDLEEIGMETAETLLLEAAGADQSKERTDRQVVIPWMKFLWEVFRVVLDIVKSHSKLETCYHDMAKHAFRFCQKYNRFSEFRRLCDILRQHLNFLIKYPRPNANDVQISSQETTQHFLETRFLQLQTSVELRNWQEAYRTIEDIHMLISLSKKMPRAQIMGIYYERLTLVFWMSKNYLYHAHALYKLYSLNIKQNKSLSPEVAKMMGTKLLLAALSVPPFDSHSAMLADSYGFSDIGGAAGENAARHSRMAAILGYSAPAQRSTLVDEILQKKINESCHDEVKELFPLLEEEMEPLTLASRLKPILDFIANTEELASYAEPLRKVAVFRLLDQLGKVYSVMKISEVKTVASFTTMAEVERTALEALKTRSLFIRFDHQNDCIMFESSLFSTTVMREQLMSLGQRLEMATKMWGLTYSVRKEEQLDDRRAAAVQLARTMAPKEQRENLSRKVTIERRKEEQERRSSLAAAEMKRQAALAKKKRDDFERNRMREEKEQRDRERQRREEEEVARRARDESEQEVTGAAVEEEADPELDAEVQLAKQKEREMKAQREAEKRVALLSKKMDYLERALRTENKPLVREDWQKHCEELDRLADESRKKMIDVAKKKHESNMRHREILSAVKPEIDRFIAQVVAASDAEFEKWLAEKQEEERRMREDEERRNEQERIAEEQRRAEETRIREEEARRAEAARLAEEERRKQEEEEAARKAEEEASRRKIIEAAKAERAAEEAAKAAEERPAAPTTYVPPVGNATANSNPPQRRPLERYQPPASRGTGGFGGDSRFGDAKKTGGDAPYRPRTGPGAPAPPAASVPLAATAPPLTNQTKIGWRERQRLKEEAKARGESAPADGDPPPR